MIALAIYAVVAMAGVVTLWSLPWCWVRRLNAADAYRTDWTRDRDQHLTDVRESMQGRWVA